MICRRCNLPVASSAVTTTQWKQQAWNASDKCFLVLSSGGVEDAEQESLLSEKERMEAVEVHFSTKLMWLGSIRSRGSDQLVQAAKNMTNNASFLHGLVSPYLDTVKNIPMGKQIANIQKKILPAVKVVFSATGASFISEMVGLAAETFFGSIFDVCDEVVHMSCAEIQMALSSYLVGDKENTVAVNMREVADSFLDMFNAINMKNYTHMGIHPDLMTIISEKFMKSSSKIAETSEQVMSALAATHRKK